MAYNHPMERYKNSRYFSAVADNARCWWPQFAVWRPRLDFREDVFTRRPAKGTSSQHFHVSVSISFKTEHLYFAGPPKSGEGFLRQNLERANMSNMIAGGTSFLLSPVLY